MGRERLPDFYSAHAMRSDVETCHLLTAQLDRAIARASGSAAILVCWARKQGSPAG